MAVPKKRSTYRIKSSKLTFSFKNLKATNCILKKKSLFDFKKFTKTNSSSSVFYL